MTENKLHSYIQSVLENVPSDWLNLTTHRLDIYNESLAKTEFIKSFENLYNNNVATQHDLAKLPTAYDYIRLGHPLSCVLEWCIAQLNITNYLNVISFSSETMPILAVLRKNKILNKKTQIAYTDALPYSLDLNTLKTIYNYHFETIKVDGVDAISNYEGTTLFVSKHNTVKAYKAHPNIDFNVFIYPKLGSIIQINGEENEHYISSIQHVRRRETIAMTPANTYTALESLASKTSFNYTENALDEDKKLVLETISAITDTKPKPLVATSGLSMQYAIMMGLIDDANENHKGKAIKFLVPPNCYGGTNDQARRVAESIANVEILDLPVDGNNDMVTSIDRVLENVAHEDAVPYIIAEIPTNPRVEVPNLENLKAVLGKKRQTVGGQIAIAPVFILDQTFCPNVHFLGDDKILSNTFALSYVSGSKFPSGGKCTAGYCVADHKAEHLLKKIEKHLVLCNNEATDLQYKILAEQLPSMKQRITHAYNNTRHFVNFIKESLPEAKINFVSDALAKHGFTPSVFSLRLPAKGNTEEEKEAHRRKLNLKLIHLMISKIPNESKFCVSYGQLKGSYWAIPATSTQGTTKESDKDYIVRASLSPDFDIEQHKTVFNEFVQEI